MTWNTGDSEQLSRIIKSSVGDSLRETFESTLHARMVFNFRDTNGCEAAIPISVFVMEIHVALGSLVCEGS